MTALEAQQELRHIVLRVSTNGLSYDEGKAMALPLLDIINSKGREIAKKWKRTYRPLTWGYALTSLRKQELFLLPGAAWVLRCPLL